MALEMISSTYELWCVSAKKRKEVRKSVCMYEEREKDTNTCVLLQFTLHLI